jgi:hypothetical protein
MGLDVTKYRRYGTKYRRYGTNYRLEWEVYYGPWVGAVEAGVGSVMCRWELQIPRDPVQILAVSPQP